MSSEVEFFCRVPTYGKTKIYISNSNDKGCLLIGVGGKQYIVSAKDLLLSVMKCMGIEVD